ncbi:MAG TPA: type II CAAX endopeptidase family protein [Anaerolineales bacterium]|nr:type II CAAX endopeptidase family protein [Anaerolineales bacterium]
MKTLTSIIKQHALALFCGLTIALTFAATLLPLPGELVAVVMVFIPALLAISLTAVSEGREGIRALLGKLAQWRISLKWVAMALVLALVIRLTMSLIALGLGMISTIQLRPGGTAQYIILAIVFFVFAIPEELGWRGYALPKLLQRYSPLAAGLIIGVLWGSLHLALLLPGMMNEGASPLATLLGLVGGSVLFTWLYVNSDGSIVLTTLFHAAQSFFVIVNEGLTGTQQAWLMAGVYLAVALIVVLATGPRLTRRPVARISQTVQATGTSQPLPPK